MIPKIILTVLVIIFVMFNMRIIQKREYIKPLEQLLFVNPIIYKMFTNIYSTFYADKLWLLSSQIDEVSKIRNKKKTENIDINKIKKAYTTINYLDPNFTQPISYVVSYIIMNKKNYKLGMEILNNAIKKSPNNYKLLFIKLIFMTTYNPNKPDVNEAMKIAEILYKKNIIFIGVLKVSDFVAELIEHYTEDEKEKIKNIKKLYNFTKNKEIKKDLDNIIKVYKEKKGDKNEK